MTDFDPWRRADQLPDRAPIRLLRPDALLTAILRRDWTAWLVAMPGKPPRFTGYVLEPRFGAGWAMGRGATPAAALGAVFVLCLDAPPWERRPEDDALSDLTQGHGRRAASRARKASAFPAPLLALRARQLAKRLTGYEGFHPPPRAL